MLVNEKVVTSLFGFLKATEVEVREGARQRKVE